jgi:hypothetical protein
MKVLFCFIFSAETWTYLQWRWRQEGWRSVSVIWDWGFLLLKMLRHKAPRSSKRFADLPLAPVMADPTFTHYFFRPENVVPLATTIKGQFPKEVGDVLQKAEYLINQGKIFLPTKIAINFRLHGWRPPIEDREHFFALHRWSFGVGLAKAWAFSGNERLAQHFESMLQSWIDSAPSDARDAAWESYSVSERMVHWCFCITLLWNVPRFREQTYPVLARQLRLHADWLAGHLETEKIHNHLINNGRALYTVGLFLNMPEHRSLGWSLLERELDRQVLPDGFLREQSVPYHLLLTRTFIECHLLASLAKEKMSPTFTDRVRKMVDVAAAFVRPDGSCPLIGDVSPDIELNVLAGTIAAGQVDFHMPQSVPMTEQGSWLVGGAAKFISPVETRTVFLPDAGYVIHRTDDLHLVFHTDPRAEIVRHGHADALGICLWRHGREILRDSGNFSYRFDPWWTYFHGPAGHTGISLAGLPCYPLTDFLAPWYAEDYRRASAGLAKPREVSPWTCVSGWHSGYSRLGSRLIVRRRLILGPEYLWVTDWMEGQNRQRFEARWNLPSKEDSELSMVWLLDGRPIDVQWHKGQRTPTLEGWHSAAYGLKEASSTACFSGFHAKDITRLDLLLGWEKPAPHKLIFAERNEETIESPAWADVFDVPPDGSRFGARRREAEARL